MGDVILPVLYSTLLSEEEVCTEFLKTCSGKVTHYKAEDFANDLMAKKPVSL